jgi:hypothetical protein
MVHGKCFLVQTALKGFMQSSMLSLSLACGDDMVCVGAFLHLSVALLRMRLARPRLTMIFRYACAMGPSSLSRFTRPRTRGLESKAPGSKQA